MMTDLDDEDPAQWTNKVIGRIWSQVLEDHEARNNLLKNIMWRSTGETEGRGAITFTCVCEQCPVEDFLCWAGHEERRKQKGLGVISSVSGVVFLSTWTPGVFSNAGI